MYENPGGHDPSMPTPMVLPQRSTRSWERIL